MKAIKVYFIIISMISSTVFAMEEEKPSCLRTFSKASTKDIQLSKALEGSEEQQKRAVQFLVQKLPSVIVYNGQHFEVDAPKFKTLLATTYRGLPQPKIKKSGRKKAVSPVNSPVPSRLAAVAQLLSSTPAEDPNVAQLQADVARLTKAVSGKGRWVKLIAGGGALFFTGMIVGWFYTTRAHHQAGYTSGQ